MIVVQLLRGGPLVEADFSIARSGRSLIDILVHRDTSETSYSEPVTLKEARVI